MSIELKRKPAMEEIEQICTAAEEAARSHLLSHVSLKRIIDLDVVVEAEGDKPLVLSVDVGLELSTGNQDLKALVNEAAEAAFTAAEAKVRELNLCADTTA